MNRIFAVLFGLLVFLPTASQAADFHFGVNAVSGYVWRGQEIGSASAIAVQPSVALNAGRLSLSAQANSFVQDRDVLGSVGEARVTVAHAFALDQADLSVGVHQDFYAHSDSEDTATEVYAGLHLPAPLSPQITVHYNFSDLDRWGYDWYATLAGSTHVYCVDVGASLGLSDADGWMDFHDLEISAARRFDLPHVSVTPHVRLSVSGRDTRYYILGASFDLR